MTITLDSYCHADIGITPDGSVMYSDLYTSIDCIIYKLWSDHQYNLISEEQKIFWLQIIDVVFVD